VRVGIYAFVNEWFSFYEHAVAVQNRGIEKAMSRNDDNVLVVMNRVEK